MKIYKDKDNNTYAYELDGSQDHLIPKEYILIDEAEYKIIQDNLQKAIQDARTYVEKRQEAYPAIAEQLDIIYHQGIDAWKKIITDIKTQIPKE